MSLFRPFHAAPEIDVNSPALAEVCEDNDAYECRNDYFTYVSFRRLKQS